MSNKWEKKNPYTHRMIHWNETKKNKNIYHNNLRCSHFIRFRCVMCVCVWTAYAHNLFNVSARRSSVEKEMITRRLHAVDMWYSIDVLALYEIRTSRLKPETICAGMKKKTPPIRIVFTLYVTSVKLCTRTYSHILTRSHFHGRCCLMGLALRHIFILHAS